MPIAGIGATVIGTVSVGGSEVPGIYSIVIGVNIVNTMETPLYVPTRGFKYYCDEKPESGRTKVFASIKEEKSVTGYKMPFSAGDLRIIKLLKDEAAVVRIELGARGNRLEHLK